MTAAGAGRGGAASGEGDARAEAAAVALGAGSSFAAGMRVLPRRRREAIFAIYAFCRTVDDVADEPGTREEKTRALDFWAEEAERACAGRPTTPLGRALVEPVARFDLPQAEFLNVVEGMRMDVDGPVVAPEEARFALYLRRVAGAVGLLSMRAFGAWRGAPSERFALALGDALQLVNITRDVEEDAKDGRLYLPAEVLARFGAPADPARIAGHPALPAIRAELGARATARFDAARREVPAHSRLALAPALMMMGPYARLLARMERSGWRAPTPRLSRGEKIRAALRCALRPAAQP